MMRIRGPSIPKNTTGLLFMETTSCQEQLEWLKKVMNE